MRNGREQRAPVRVCSVYRKCGFLPATPKGCLPSNASQSSPSMRRWTALLEIGHGEHQVLTVEAGVGPRA